MKNRGLAPSGIRPEGGRHRPRLPLLRPNRAGACAPGRTPPSSLCPREPGCDGRGRSRYVPERALATGLARRPPDRDLRFATGRRRGGEAPRKGGRISAPPPGTGPESARRTERRTRRRRASRRRAPARVSCEGPHGREEPRRPAMRPGGRSAPGASRLGPLVPCLPLLPGFERASMRCRRDAFSSPGARYRAGGLNPPAPGRRAAPPASVSGALSRRR